MKKIESLINLLLIPIDAFWVFFAFIIAYFARARSIPLPVVYIWPFDQYLTLALLMTPIWVLGFSFVGLYSGQRPRGAELGKIIAGASIGAMALVLWVFLNRSDFFSRLIIFYIWVLCVITVTFGRTVLALIQSNLYLFGLKKKNLVIVGRDDDDIRLAQPLERRPSLGYRIYGILSQTAPKNQDYKYLGAPDQIEEVLKKHHIDELILTDTKMDDNIFFLLMRSCQEADVTFKAIPAHAQSGARTLQFDAFTGVPIIEFKGTPLDSWGIALKRTIDFVGSAILIIIFFPLMLLITILIKLDSKGPVIYRNIRVGNRGEFGTLKFRTMKTDFCTGSQYGGHRAEEFEKELIEKKNIKKGSAVYKIAGDPRVTKVGNFLRKTSLDELPQFFNVFLGNMSLAGPRPHQPREVKNYTKEQRKLLMVKPGISGLAQISGRSDLSFDEEARLDIFYLENWTIWLDFYILAKTVSAVFKGKGSY